MTDSPTLLLGDCFEVLQTLADESVDACVTDPPYGLSFMGKDGTKCAGVDILQDPEGNGPGFADVFHA